MGVETYGEKITKQDHHKNEIIKNENTFFFFFLSYNEEEGGAIASHEEANLALMQVMEEIPDNVAMMRKVL